MTSRSMSGRSIQARSIERHAGDGGMRAAISVVGPADWILREDGRDEFEIAYGTGSRTTRRAARKGMRSRCEGFDAGRVIARRNFAEVVHDGARGRKGLGVIVEAKPVSSATPTVREGCARRNRDGRPIFDAGFRRATPSMSDVFAVSKSCLRPGRRVFAGADELEFIGADSSAAGPENSVA